MKAWHLRLERPDGALPAVPAGVKVRLLITAQPGRDRPAAAAINAAPN